MKTTKITYECNGKKISVEIDHEDVTIDEVLDAFVSMLYGSVFHKETVDSGIIELAEELNDK